MERKSNILKQSLAVLLSIALLLGGETMPALAADVSAEGERSETTVLPEEENYPETEDRIDPNGQEIVNEPYASLDDRTPEAVALADGQEVSGLAIVQEARKYVGNLKYVYGGTSLTTGADCSGFLCRIYEIFGINLWAHRTQMYQYRDTIGTDIGTDLNNAVAADIVVFSGHVGMVSDKRTIINLQSSGCKEVSYTQITSWAGQPRCIIRPYGVIQGTPEEALPAPSFDNVSIGTVNYTYMTYQVTAEITAPAGLDRVQVPAWTEANGRDDLWDNWAIDPDTSATLTSLGDNRYRCEYTVRLGDHGYEFGRYITQIHAFDKQGHCSIYECVPVEVSNKVQLSSQRYSQIQPGKGYHVTANVVSASNVDKIEFLVWTGNSQDDLKVTVGSTPSKTIFHYEEGDEYNSSTDILTSDHGGKDGVYHNAVRVYTSDGQVTTLNLDDINLSGESNGTCGDNLTWRLAGSGNDLSLYIEGSGEMYDYRGNTGYTGAPENATPWYLSADKIRHIYLPDGLTSIGSYAFCEMNVQQISFPNGLTSIGSYAFAHTSLRRIVLPDSISIIKDAAFVDCTELKGTLDLPSGLTEIGSRAFLGTGYDTLVFHGPSVKARQADGVSRMSISNQGKREDLENPEEPHIFPETYSGEYTIVQCIEWSGTWHTVYISVTEHHFIDETQAVLVYPPEEEGKGSAYPWETPAWRGYPARPGTSTENVSFELNQRSVKLEEGDQAELKADFGKEEARPVVWTSGNEKVAIVDVNGMVTALKSGNTIITAGVEGSSFTQECKVFVSPKLTREISLNYTEASLKIGESLQLIGEVLPTNASNKNLSWYSCDENVVTVSSTGLLKAVAEGSASIVVRVEDGCAYAYCEVTVTNTTGGGDISGGDVSGGDVSGGDVSGGDTPGNDSPGKNPIARDCKVSFNLQGHGTAIEFVIVKEGDKMTAPAKPQKLGYLFEGWFKESSCVTAWDFGNDIVTADMTLYAKWNVDKNTVTPADMDDLYYAQGTRHDLKIMKCQISDIKPKVYDGKPYLPAVKVAATVGGKTAVLTEGVDYRVLYKNNVKAGTGQVIVKGNGEYTGELIKEFQITPKPIGRLKVTAGGLGKNAATKDMPIYLYDGSYRLEKGKDYIIEPVAAGFTSEKGMKDVIVTAVKGGNYDGSRKVKIAVYDTDKVLNDCDVTVERAILDYTGKALQCGVKVTYNGKTLTEKQDYIVKYTNNRDAGTAYVTVTGKKEYCGCVVKTFEIRTAAGDFKLKTEPKAVIYNGKLQKPKLSVVDVNGKTLKANKDYILLYNNNFHVGKAVVTIKGLGNYSGTKDMSVNFNILPQKISKVSVKGTKTSGLILSYTKRWLKEGVDYELKFGGEDKGRAEVIVIGKGDFEGTVIKKVKSQ